MMRGGNAVPLRLRLCYAVAGGIKRLFSNPIIIRNSMIGDSNQIQL